MNYAKGKCIQGHSSAKLFLKSVMEKTDFMILSDVYLPMCEFFVESNLLEEAKELLDFLKTKKEEFRAPHQLVELYKLYVEYYKKQQDTENLFLSYENYYQANRAYEIAMIEEKQKSMQIQMELHNAIKKQKNILEKNRELERMSEHDALTGLANRYSINKYCEQMFNEAYRKQRKFGTIIVDIDYFKEFNDTYGHIEGDRCICDIAHIVEQNASEFLTARFGGDEFLIMALDASDEVLKNTAQKINEEVRKLKIAHSGSKIAPFVTVSLGITNGIPKSSETVVDFIQMADIALYKVKKSRRDSFGCYTD